MLARSFNSPRLTLPILAGLAASLALAGLYLGIVTLASGSWAHTADLFREDRWFVVPIVLGFGVQMGLYVYLRKGLYLPQGAQAAEAVAGAGTGTSTLAMVACCAHHISDVLPLVGLSAAAVFLAEYKVPFMVAGLVTNVVAIGVMLRLIRRAQVSGLRSRVSGLRSQVSGLR